MTGDAPPFRIVRGSSASRRLARIPAPVRLPLLALGLSLALLPSTGCAWLRRASGLGEPFVPIFDGRTLEGWESPDMSWWTVEDGAITGTISEERPLAVNQYLVWKGGELADFELKLRFRLTGTPGTNGGFQFRSRVLPDHDVAGYQVDNNRDTPWLVRLYDEHGRHDLALHGESATFRPGGAREVSPIPGVHGRPPDFALDEWHEYHLIARGTRLELRVEGRKVAEVLDEDPAHQDPVGILALQLHSGPPMKAQFRDIRLRRLSR